MKLAIKNVALLRKLRLYFSYITIALKIFILTSAICVYQINFFRQKTLSFFYELSLNLGLKLNNLVISGNKNFKTASILKNFNANKGKSILAFDIIALKNKLEQNDWIKSAEVVRKLPDTIQISLKERVPVAIWQNKQKLYLVDKDGCKISTERIDSFALLHVIGEGANTHAAKLVNQLSTCPSLASRILYVSRYGNRRWNIMLEEDILIKMPEENFENAWNYLTKLEHDNKLFGNNIKTLDLRDSKRGYIEKNEADKNS